MRITIYNFLVNRHEGIRLRYHRIHDGAAGYKKALSWAFLIWMNLANLVTFGRAYRQKPDENRLHKPLPIDISESAQHLKAHPDLSVDAYVNRLSPYDIISFDIFDTLIFRPVAAPVDAFYFIGERLGLLDFKNLRTWAEWDARQQCLKKHGHTEITLHDIWQRLYEEAGYDPEIGMQTEMAVEMDLCYANPLMLAVWQRLHAAGKRVIVISDMYLPAEFLRKLLEKNGFTGAEKVYVSCEHGVHKAEGKLFDLVKQDIESSSASENRTLPKSWIHVGDNPVSDYKSAREHGFDAILYPRTDEKMRDYRPFDMSPMLGSAYRSLVNARLYSGLQSYSIPYEYGYIYGGLFVTGYCHFIHEYAKTCGIDRLLFLSRDGDILKQVYDRLYPGEDTVYTLWSRKAGTILMAGEDKHDYYRRFIHHKVNQNYQIEQILRSMRLDNVIELDLKKSDLLTDKNAMQLQALIDAQWPKVMDAYKDEMAAAEAYMRKILEGASKAAAIDIGWAGSGAVAISHLVEKVWQIPCRITGIVAGTNTIHNTEPDAGEPMLQSGKLASYMYSQRHNRDLLKIHDPGKDYNIYWELLLSSQQPQFDGFDLDEEGGVIFRYGKKDPNQEGIAEIQKGIKDFAEDYEKYFKAFPYMLDISGRDAYAPMLVAAERDRRYLKMIEKLFSLDPNVD